MLSLKELLDGIDLAKVMEADKRGWMSCLPVGDTVPASSSKPTNLIVPTRGIFLNLGLTGRFSSLSDATTDSGVCPLSMKWANGSQRIYISQPVYLDCLFTPGRVRTAGVTGDPGGQLQFPGIEWVTVFQPGDTLTFTVTNDAAYANSWQIDLFGLWVLK